MEKHGILVILFSLYLSISPVSSTSINVGTDCSCGYYDASTKNLFTESVIAYFNETAGVPEDFVVQSYENKYEKSWNDQFRQGADLANVDVGNSSNSSEAASLELYLSPSTPNHLVVGGGVVSSRQDIFYGSFRALFRPTDPWHGGSALSMILEYNESQSIEMNQLNRGPYDSFVSTIVHDEFPERDLGVNFSSLQNTTSSPWGYNEYQIDWTDKEVNYFVQGQLVRTVSRKKDPKMPTSPSALYLKHWSTGNYFSMQGPPLQRTVANIGWVRMFFNSSLMTSADHVSFDARCQVSDACAMDDTSLRGSSPYPTEATIKWKQFHQEKKRPLVPFLIVLICACVSFIVLSNTLIKRIPWAKIKTTRANKKASPQSFHRSAAMATGSQDALHDPETSSQAPSALLGSEFSMGHSPSMTPFPPTSPRSSSEMIIRMSAVSPDVSVDALGYKPGVKRIPRQEPRWDGSSTAYTSERDFGSDPNQFSHIDTASQSKEKVKGQDMHTLVTVTSVPPTPAALNVDTIERDIGPNSTPAPPGRSPLRNELGENQAIRYDSSSFALYKAPSTTNDQSGMEALVARDTVPPTYPAGDLPTGKRRLDYLAGLVALAALLVTAIHFCLTFVPSAIDPDAFAHYSSENWARKTVSSYFLNLVWIGPFLLSSTRFLTSGYLRNGDLHQVAEKTVGRPFRLLIPIVAVAMMEYFLMDSGAVTWLEYLPSVTWSTLPFAYVPNNFGHFVSEILELAYLIPPAQPNIIFNFCTGVLWTIPVQLQGSWISLLAVIVIRELKTPWKRFGFYAFCILMHWYAVSWGTYFYFGVLLADLDVTYKWRKYLYSHPFIYFPLIASCALLALGGLTMDVVTQSTGVNYAAWEYGIHPDGPTGKPIFQTGAAGYPLYYYPKLNGLVFACGLQTLVEVSPIMQKAFSFKLLTYVFPHIFTIYLIHGFIFYSLGSCVCVYLAAHGFPYWLNLVVVAICCYATLLLSLPLLTPVVETLGKHVTRNIWKFANEEPAPRRPTLFPFGEDILEERPTADVPEEKNGLLGKEDVVDGEKTLSTSTG